MDTKIIPSVRLVDLFEALLASGKIIVAPVRNPSGKVFFQPVQNFAEIDTESVQTTFSAKSVVFPKVEELFAFQRTEEGFEVKASLERLPEIVVWGLHPCDASAFDYMNDFFSRDTPDVYVRKRKEHTTLITFGCSRCDEQCFCTSVGSNPGDTKGSDLLLTLMGEVYYAEILTDKGAAVLDVAAGFFNPSDTLNKSPYLAQPTAHFSMEEIQLRIRDAYERTEWKHLSMGCFGCGTCAFVCPTCTCFDIQDEGTQDKGRRIRCWDACGFGQFTKHASGHNPRTNQTERRRQRLMHKFKYSVETMDVVSCVGCGRCIRSCPSHLNIFENILSVTR
jgi:sulfhydrogenase subunit beta (sulfur reductase)